MLTFFRIIAVLLLSSKHVLCIVQHPTPLTWSYTDFQPPKWEKLGMYPTSVTIPMDDNSLILSYDGLTARTWLLDTKLVDDVLNIGSWMWVETALQSKKNPGTRQYYALSSVAKGKVILFGGEADEHGPVYSDVWLFDLYDSGGQWVQLTFSGESPEGRIHHAMAPLSNQRMLLFGGHDGKLLLSDTWIFDYTTANWSRIMTDQSGPPPLSDPAMSPIPGNNSILLYGVHTANAKRGSSWVFDDSSISRWTHLSVSDPLDPKTRMPLVINSLATVGSLQVLLYNHKTCTMWLFDGEWHNKLNGPTFCSQSYWNQKKPLIPLSSKQGVRALTFGKFGNKAPLSNSAWIYDANETSFFKAEDAPKARDAHSMCSLGNQNILLFGGYSPDSLKYNGYLKDTWVLNTDYKIKGVASPRWARKMDHLSARSNAALAYLSTGKAVLFGGQWSSGDHPTQIIQFTDTSIFQLKNNGQPDFGEWKTLLINNSPSPRTLHAMATLTTLGSVLLYGGCRNLHPSTNQDFFSDTWIFSEKDGTLSWTEISTTNIPKEAGRCGHNMAFLKDGSVLMYGGFTNVISKPKLASSDTWIFNLTTHGDEGEGKWEKIMTDTSPPPTAFHALSSFNNERVLMNGGCTGCNNKISLFVSEQIPAEGITCQDYMFYRETKTSYNWRLVDSSTFFYNILPPRVFHSMALSIASPVDSKIYVFGGYAKTTQYGSSKILSRRPSDDLWMMRGGCFKGTEGPSCSKCKKGQYSMYNTFDNATCSYCPTNTTTRFESGSWFKGDCSNCDVENQNHGKSSYSTSGGTCSVSVDYVATWQCFGFTFGPTCERCPGSIITAGKDIIPCNGHGTCSTGESGTGECTCIDFYITFPINSTDPNACCKKDCGQIFCNSNQEGDQNFFAPGGKCVDPWKYHHIHKTFLGFEKTPGHCACNSMLYGWSEDCSFPVAGILLLCGFIFFAMSICYRWRYKREKKNLILLGEDLYQQGLDYKLLGGELQETKIELGNREEIISMQRNTMMINEKDLEWDIRLAAGGFGEVWKGKWKVKPNEDVAIKKMFINAENIDMCLDHTPFDDKEINVLMRAGRHARVVLFYGAGQLQDDHIFLVTEFMEGGDLFHLLSNGKPLAWDTRKSILSDIASGMNELHSQNMLHRDLKSMNVLLDLQNRAKIADFGLSKFGRQKRQNKKTPESNSLNIFGFEGGVEELGKVNDDNDDNDDNDNNNVLMTYGSFSIPWTAPEMLEKAGAVDGKFMASYGLPVDVYAFAIVSWEVMTIEIPWNDIEKPVFHNIANYVLDGKRPPISEVVKQETDLHFSELYSIVQNCWEQNPNNRPKFDEIFKRLEKYHKW
jgi:hypothetical protein